MTFLRTVRVAAIQATPVILDAEATVRTVGHFDRRVAGFVRALVSHGSTR